MELNEAKQILKRAGYLLEFRDSSNPLDRETEESNWNSDKVSWINSSDGVIFVDRNNNDSSRADHNVLDWRVPWT